MSKVQSNKEAWGKLSKNHYEHFKQNILNGQHKLNPIIKSEIGDISGKKVLHLQCNTGADSIMLAKMGADVTGVDFVPDNVYYAKKLADDLDVGNVRFIESDVLKFDEIHNEKYDMVYTTEGVLIWISDKGRWAQVIRHCLKDDGFLYVHDSHPFYYVFDEVEFAKGNLIAKYPYFNKKPDEFDSIGGYATEEKTAQTYEWMYTIGEVVNALSDAGLCVEYLNEYDRCSKGMADGCDKVDSEGLTCVSAFEGKIPLVFSLKATVK
jgi:SAM-dependent methyltransferase